MIPQRIFRLLALGTGMLITLVHVSCNTRTPVEKANSEGILILSNSAEPEGLDPQAVSGVPENNIMRALFEGLCIEDPKKDGNSLPGAATRWENNADYTVWTFHLQPDGKWSDGTPITTEDFLFSYQRILHPDFAAKSSAMLYFIQGAEDYNKGKTTDFSSVGVQAIDSHTLQITTRASLPFLPELTKHYSWFPIPKHIVLQHGTMTEKHTGWTEPGNHVSNGPFKLSEWKFNYYISTVKNAHYWDSKQVALNGIRFLPISNTYTEARMFFDQQIHVTYGLAPEMIEYSRERYPDSLRQEPYLGTAYLRCNVTRPGLTDPRVRQALSLAIDRQAIIENIAKGRQLPAHGFTPSFGGYNPPDKIFFDPQKAKQLLADAGYPNGEGFPKTTLLTTDRELSKRLSEAYQDMWKKHLGIQVSIKQQEWKTYLDSRSQLNFDFCVSSWVGDYPDPTSFLELWVKNNGNNCTGWSHPTFEKLLTQAETCATPAQRFSTLAEAEALLLEEMPIIPVYWLTTNYLLHPSVQGWHPLILNNHPYKFIRLESLESLESQKSDPNH